MQFHYQSVQIRVTKSNSKPPELPKSQHHFIFSIATLDTTSALPQQMDRRSRNVAALRCARI